MDARSELARERGALARADADLRQGEERIAAQEKLVSNLRAKGMDPREAERLLALLRDTLLEWRQHRALTLQRIGYLELKLSASGSSPTKVDAKAPG